MTLACQQPKHGQTFHQWTEDAERRMTNGERQVWCMTCDRFKFRDELCSDARTLQAHKQAALMDDTDTLPLFAPE